MNRFQLLKQTLHPPPGYSNEHFSLSRGFVLAFTVQISLWQYFFHSCPLLSYLVASHAVAVKNADLLVLLAGHVVQALVGLHIAYLCQTHIEATVQR